VTPHPKKQVGCTLTTDSPRRVETGQLITLQLVVSDRPKSVTINNVPIPIPTEGSYITTQLHVTQTTSFVAKIDYQDRAVACETSILVTGTTDTGAFCHIAAFPPSVEAGGKVQLYMSTTSPVKETILDGQKTTHRVPVIVHKQSVIVHQQSVFVGEAKSDKGSGFCAVVVPVKAQSTNDCVESAPAAPFNSGLFAADIDALARDVASVNHIALLPEEQHAVTQFREVPPAGLELYQFTQYKSPYDYQQNYEPDARYCEAVSKAFGAPPWPEDQDCPDTVPSAKIGFARFKFLPDVLYTTKLGARDFSFILSPDVYSEYSMRRFGVDANKGIVQLSASEATPALTQGIEMCGCPYERNDHMPPREGPPPMRPAPTPIPIHVFALRSSGFRRIHVLYPQNGVDLQLMYHLCKR